jgi:hypothetical protein
MKLWSKLYGLGIGAINIYNTSQLSGLYIRHARAGLSDTLALYASKTESLEYGAIVVDPEELMKSVSSKVMGFCNLL